MGCKRLAKSERLRFPDRSSTIPAAANAVRCSIDLETYWLGRMKEPHRMVPTRMVLSSNAMDLGKARNRAGHDFSSFASDGRSRVMEVKTAKGWERTLFFISRSQIAVSEEHRAAKQCP